MMLESFKKRDQTELHEDIAVGLSPFEQKMSKQFSRVETMGKRGRKVAILLNPELVRAIQLLVDKRDACEVDRDNTFLFGRPKCSATSFFRGQDCIRLPDATIEIAKISKLLLAMEKGTLTSFQGKSLDEIEIQGKRKNNQNEAESSRVAKSWSPDEVNAVMKHFKSHILKGHLATKAECEQCKRAEGPVLKERTIQNIRDFVRNRGVQFRKCS
ncbi:uncharacterized protein LOC131350517 [Hemibagrus wyckioides]|uniref:uncharacterized protein LOC131350517 n=1 Tax=Hemibagrus wyckioides TaxID=337641 RepID=UPI00266D1B20|nr:uncharacterized protein LOC131350517 [Hemibagrus wyckioides]